MEYIEKNKDMVYYGRAPVAQLVEQTTYTRPVGGSSPPGRTLFKMPNLL